MIAGVVSESSGGIPVGAAGGSGGSGDSGASPATAIDTSATSMQGVPTLAAAYANYYQGIQTGTLGGLTPPESESFMNGAPSLQPVAPQEPGNVLTGRFGTPSARRWLWIGSLLAVAFLVWYFWKRSGTK